MTRTKVGAFVVAGLALAFALAFFVAPHASSKPDGLNKVAADKGFASQEKDHALKDTPTAGYGDNGLPTGVAGVIGVAVTFAFGAGLFAIVRRGSRSRAAAGSA